jgi:hypothetical protein
MYLQEILEVAIGLVFMWLVLSIAAMTIQEWIGNVLAWRANALEKSIRGMLTSGELTKKLYEHPLIASLYQSAKKAGKKPRLPSYIPAAKFASALFDIVTQAGTEASPLKNLTSQIDDQLAAVQNPEQRKLAKEDWATILETAKQVAASGVSRAAVDSLRVQVQAYGDKYPEIQPTLNLAMPQVDAFYQKFLEQQKVAVASSPSTDLAMRLFRLGLLALEGIAPKFKDTMAALLRNAEVYSLQGEQAVAEAVRVSIETWFNDAMDRLSGSYKRKAQLASFVIGFVLALILNVDSINVATSLWREPTLRQAIIAQVESYAQQNQRLSAQTTTDGSTPDLLQTIPELQQQLQALNIPFGWTTAVIDTGGKQCALFPFKGNQIWGIVGQNGLGVPVCKRVDNFPVDLSGWLGKLLGLIITGAATAQGAPFWFDILKKLINVRSSGPNPAEQAPVG